MRTRLLVDPTSRARIRRARATALRRRRLSSSSMAPARGGSDTSRTGCGWRVRSWRGGLAATASLQLHQSAKKLGDTPDPDTACPSACVTLLRFCFLLPVLLCVVVVCGRTPRSKLPQSWQSGSCKKALGRGWRGGRREKGTGQRMHVITYDLCWICSMSS
jgi:hypothetical protein